MVAENISKNKKIYIYITFSKNLEMTPIVYCGKKSINAAAINGHLHKEISKILPPFYGHFFKFLFQNQ